MAKKYVFPILPKELQGKEMYWCKKCKHIHNRFRKSDGSKIKVFYQHVEWYELKTKSELWRMQFKKGWQRAVKKHNVM